MTTSDVALVMTRVQTVLVEEMTPEQRARAGAALRGLPGDDAERAFFSKMADTLDEFNARKQAELEAQEQGSRGNRPDA